MVRTVASRQRELGGVIGSLLPLLLITISASGGFYAAIDLTAGEKERNTMQTLLCAPVRSTEIIVGKFLAVWTVVMVSGLANVVSMAVTFARMGSSLGGLSLPASTYALAFLALLPVTFTVSGLFLAVAVFARDFKDGQNMLTPVLLVLMVPVAVTMIPGFDLDAATSFVPIVNVALLIKALFIGEVRAQALFLTLLASALYAALAMIFAARVFAREQVLLGGRESLRRLLGLEEWRGRPPTPGLAVTLYACLLVLTFYASRLIENQSVLTQLLVVQYAFFALPTLGLALGLGLPLRQTFSLRAPSLRALAGAALIGVSAWAVAGATLVRLAPPPPEFARRLADSLLLGGQASLPLLLLTVALTPALCEELLFRGFILSGLKRQGPWVAIGLSALLFALMHASIYRLLPTLALGLLLGYAVWRSGSVLCGMVGHLFNNGIAVVLLHRAAGGGRLSDEALGGAAGGYVPWDWAAVAAVVLTVGVWLVHGAGRRGSTHESTEKL
jgi:sodium transport system permease protein